ncbi:MAG: zinc-binding dehydrogenase [Thermoleophilia bacterium]|nr:zinc-binding dehydrogenase [Thermoleophilia bacterium]
MYHHGDGLGIGPGSRVGHEFVGIVEEVGEAVRAVAPGDRVLAPFWFSCGRCPFCREELFTSCLVGGCFGFQNIWTAGGPVEGAQSERVRVPYADGTLERIPEALAAPEHDARVLPLGDVLSTALHALSGARPVPGDVILVQGDGAVGLLACHAATLFGPSAVVLAGHHADRLALGRRLGATHAVDTRDRPDALAPLLADLTDGLGPQVVVCAVASPASMRAAYEAVRPGGRIGWVGMEVFSGPPDIPWDVAFLKNVTLTGGVCPSRRYIHRLWPLLERGVIDPSPVFTHTVGLDDVPAAYAAMAAREPGWVKVAVRP